MKDRKPSNPLLQNLGTFSIPLISVTAFLPLVFAYWANPQPANTSQQSVLPSVKQIATFENEKPPIPPTPVISRPEVTVTPPCKGLSGRQAVPLVSPIGACGDHPAATTPTPKTTPKRPEPQKSEPQHKAQKIQSVKSEGKAKPQPTYKRQVTATKPRKTSPLPSSPSYSPPPLEVRVAIAQDEPQLVIGVSQGAAIANQNGRVLKNLTSNQGFVVTSSGSNLSIGSSTVPSIVFVQPSPNGLVYVNDRWYRGKILIVSQGGSLLVVNYVNLEEYLYSVVGSEMHPNAPIEALKAQAIAARSYALVHLIRPASPWFNLGNTQRWQVYKGLQTEYNTTHHAVNETAGQILSYRGGVVESLYAATDEIVARAHGGRGMSQTGAYNYAKKGYDYQEILGYYYPGVGLARLVLQQ